MGYIEICLIIASVGLLIFSIVNKRTNKKLRIAMGVIASIVLLVCLVGLALVVLMVQAIE